MGGAPAKESAPQAVATECANLMTPGLLRKHWDLHPTLGAFARVKEYLQGAVREAGIYVPERELELLSFSSVGEGARTRISNLLRFR